VSAGERVAAAALALVGTPFRLHGRDPLTGLDCVGLAACALTMAGLTTQPPRRYALRNASI
jgi:cell wall-associated NlpC family hydrolase